jgi:hypothetical protein
MENKYIVHAFLDEQCQHEITQFRWDGDTGEIVPKVETFSKKWQVIILTPLWDDPWPMGNYWTRKDVYSPMKMPS